MSLPNGLSGKDLRHIGEISSLSDRCGHLRMVCPDCGKKVDDSFYYGFAAHRSNGCDIYARQCGDCGMQEDEDGFELED